MTDLTDTIKELRALLNEAVECRQPETADDLFNRSQDIFVILDAAEKAERYKKALLEAGEFFKVGHNLNAKKVVREALAPERL